MNEKIITPDMKVAQLLETYPQLETVLISIAPEFKKLSNPILRRTIARVTSLKQAAVVGNVDLSKLINALRQGIGQDEEYLNTGAGETEKTGKPVWVIEDNISVTYDASDDLKNGIHPVNKVIKEAGDLEKDKIYCLKTDFVPLPLIDLLKQKGYEVYSEKSKNGTVSTFVKGK